MLIELLVGISQNIFCRLQVELKIFLADMLNSGEVVLSKSKWAVSFHSLISGGLFETTI